MQTAVIDAYDKTDSLVLISPTGTGKTLAYLLPLARSLRTGVEGVQAVIITPSRELALQTETVFRRMNLEHRALTCYGGRPAMDEHRAMNNLHPALLIGTPGRLLDHLSKHNFDASCVRTLVIDEFDKSLELGFRDEMSEVISRLPHVDKRILLSATDSDDIPGFVGLTDEDNKARRRLLKLDYSLESTTEDRLALRLVHSPAKDKLQTLYRLLCSLGDSSTLVFVNYRESVERVAGYLLAQHFPCDTFHGGMEQADRERALYKFRNGSCPVLISTDLAARGLDIQGVDSIVHYHLPVNEEAFTHRNGRTARWQATGKAFLILHPEENLPPYIDGDTPEYVLPETTPRPPRPRYTTLYIGRGKKDKLNKVDICGFFYKIGGLSRDDLGPIDVSDHYAYVAVRRDKVKQLLALIAGEKIKGMKTLIEVAR